MTQTAARTAPVPGHPRALKTPTVAERKLRSGLRALVVRKPTVPKVEVQLTIRFGRRTGAITTAAERLLSKTITSGTSERTSFEIAMELQRLGASLQAGTGADHFALSGSVLAPNLGPYLELMAEVLSDPVFPKQEIELERPRVVQEIEITRSQPQSVAHEAMRKRLFGTHPYAVVLPEPEAVAKVGRAAIAKLHAERVQPREATLVVVGDVQPQRALDRIEQTLSAWKRRAAVPDLPVPVVAGPGPIEIVDRPGSVQTNIRLAGPVAAPGDEDSYALECANAIFGGAFMGRFIQNLREDKGYTYSPHSTLTHMQRASIFEIVADVGTEVTGASLVETRYELGRMSAMEVDKEELEAVQRYLSGIMAIRIQSQRGLAATLSRLAAFGLDVGYLKEYPRRIMAVTTADVLEASRRYMAPARLVCMLVGDAARISGEVAALEPVAVTAP